VFYTAGNKMVTSRTPSQVLDTSRATTIDKGRFSDDPPGKYDVLCGKGRERSLHLGNERFGAIIMMHAKKFNRAGNRRSLKTDVVKGVLLEVRSAGSRFFEKRRDEGSCWVEISNERIVRDKVGHALRDSRFSVGGLDRALSFMKTHGLNKPVENDCRDKLVSVPRTTRSETPPHRPQLVPVLRPGAHPSWRRPSRRTTTDIPIEIGYPKIVSSPLSISKESPSQLSHQPLPPVATSTNLLPFTCTAVAYSTAGKEMCDSEIADARPLKSLDALLKIGMPCDSFETGEVLCVEPRGRYLVSSAFVETDEAMDEFVRHINLLLLPGKNEDVLHDQEDLYGLSYLL
jgi:hypothetical protein